MDKTIHSRQGECVRQKILALDEERPKVWDKSVGTTIQVGVSKIRHGENGGKATLLGSIIAPGLPFFGSHVLWTSLNTVNDIIILRCLSFVSSVVFLERQAWTDTRGKLVRAFAARCCINCNLIQ